MRIFYFILVWKGLKSIKLKKKVFFLPISNKFAIQNKSFMQLHLIFHKTESLKIHSHRLSCFSGIEKTKTSVECEMGYVCFVLIIVFVSTHINFQYKLNSHTGLFIVTFVSFSSISLLIFSHLQLHCLLSLIFLYKFNEYERKSSLIGSTFFCV